MHFRTTATPAALALALTLAACTETPATAPAGGLHGAVTTIALKGDRLATIESEGRAPALYLQGADGKRRVRVRFANVHDKIAGNWPAEMLPVIDERILALGPAKWSPDGQQLAIVVTLAFDQSQVVVMNADGRNIRTASPNGQIILGDIDWAPDSRAIAYAMSTLSQAQGVDLFVTDLTKDAVQRITHGGRQSVMDEYRFDTSGQGLWYTQFESWSEDGRNRVSRVYHASLAGQVEGVPEKLVGNPQGITRDGSRAIVLRYGKDGGDVMELVRVPLARRGEEERLAEGELWYAELLERDDEAVLVGTPRSTGQFAFHVLGLGARGDERGALALPRGVTSMAFLRALR